MSMSPPPDLYTPNAEGEAPVVQNDNWQQLEADLRQAQEALQKPMIDTFIRQSEPQREWTVLDLKTLESSALNNNEPNW